LKNDPGGHEKIPRHLVQAQQRHAHHCGRCHTERDQTQVGKAVRRLEAGDVPKKNIAEVQPQKKSVVYLIDRPDSLQSVILAGHVAPPKSNPDEIAIETMNNILGGTFTSRVNMNLREDKHWSYGAFTFLWSAQGQRPFIAYAPVQTDKTKESLIELNKELRSILDKQPITERS